MKTFTHQEIQPSWSHGEKFNNFYTVCQGRASVKGTGTSGGFELTGNGLTLNYKQFEAGMFMIAKYDQFNAGVEVFKFNYFIVGVDQYKDTERTLGTAKNWKEVVKLTGCKTLKEAAAKNFDVRMHVTDLTYTKEMVKLYGSDSGDWYYEFEGRFCRGSGAEKLSFVQLITVEEHDALIEKKQVEEYEKSLRRKAVILQETIARMQSELQVIEDELNTK